MAVSVRWGAMASAPFLSLVPAASACAAEIAAPVVPGLDGEWDGTYDSGLGFLVRCAVHIKTDPSGTHATGDSLEFDRFGAPIRSISRQGDHLRLEAADFVIDGALAHGGTVIDATLSSAGSIRDTVPL